ncbi:MAG: molecular chaperone HtpG [Gammaproteobacteria bacterium]|nr:molecular chaperone HtpG [Gammaproteobacteria bacterium]MDH5728303.1 molecular chaperone HtpG [Gammaproteobacteria bacterium]
MTSTVDSHKETLGFETEVKQLLHLMVHALYSNKEIFLRELISNASDACDKLRFEALSNDNLYEGDTDLRIKVDFDADAGIVTIKDNGIGMSRDEVVENIGTIAKSGTKSFIEALSGDQKADSQLIGQFGVGFYSAFIVAKKVVLNTRKAGASADHGVRWESEGEGTYTLETTDKADRGTEIILFLNDEAKEFADAFRLRNVITRYSDHISIPIYMDKQGEDESGEEAINQASALWKRAKKDISEDEYNEFYKHVAHDFEDPMAYIHNHVEGNQSYSSLLYVPKRAPFDLYDRERRHGIKLYVRRVFIMEDSEKLMPEYLRFVRGVIDSDDLPLNVSREILQHNRQIDTIRGASVKKVLGMLEGIAKDDAEKYAEFWKEFGKVIKEGPAEDFANKERILKLVRFASTHNDNDTQNVSLDEYISRMKEGQTKIYYVTAETYAAAKNSPHLEVFAKKGIEVLLLCDRVDEWMMSHVTDYDGKNFQSVAKGDLDLGELEDEAEKEEHKKAAEEAKDFVDKLKEALGEKVKEVRITHRLTNSPSCLVVEDDDMAVNLQRMLKAAGQAMPETKPILEINPVHPLSKKVEQEAGSERFNAWAGILFDQAMLAEGGQLQDPAGFVKTLNELMFE